MSPYRAAPVERPAQKAARASWWRRLTHRDVERRLAIRRLRHYALAEVPFATWRARHEFAAAMWESAQGHGLETKAVVETIMRHRIATLRTHALLFPSPSATLRW